MLYFNVIVGVFELMRIVYDCFVYFVDSIRVKKQYQLEFNDIDTPASLGLCFFGSHNKTDRCAILQRSKNKKVHLPGISYQMYKVLGISNIII